MEQIVFTVAKDAFEFNGNFLGVYRSVESGEMYVLESEMNVAGFASTFAVEADDSALPYGEEFLLPVRKILDYVFDPNAPQAEVLPPQVTKTYFILAPNYKKVKIGKATNVALRLKQLQTGSPEILSLLAIVGQDIERTLHAQFSRYNSHNEWFTLSKEVVEWVAANAVLTEWGREYMENELGFCPTQLALK